jgi:hypothetical protein
MRKFIVLSLPFQLVFPAKDITSDVYAVPDGAVSAQVIPPVFLDGHIFPPESRKERLSKFQLQPASVEPKAVHF